jgi:PAS domain S-box-containing protein
MHLVRVTDITARKQAELALQEREYMLRTLGDNLPNGMIYQLVHESNGKAYFSYISAGIERLVGVKPEAIMQDASVLHNLIVEEDRLLCEQLTEESKQNLSIFEMQMRKRTTRGDIQWSYLRSAPRRLDDGRTVWNGIEMDITPLKRAEAALKESEQFLRSIYEGIETAVFMVDVLEDGRFRYVGINPAHERMSGILSSEVSGKTPEEVLTPEMAQVVSEHYRACIEAGERITYEECLLIKGQETCWITNLTPVRDSNERIYRIIGTWFNISDRKQIEEELRESALREQAVAHVLQKMRQTLDIDTIFSATTEELRGVLNCDLRFAAALRYRVAIYRFNPDWSGKFVAESLANGWVTLIIEQKNYPYLTTEALEDKNCIIKIQGFDNDSVQDSYLQNNKGGVYSQGTSYRVIEDIYSAGFTPCYINLLEQFQARAYIIVPIFCGSKLWGLLATYQNSGSRSWSEAEISVVVQIGTQLAIALQQAQLLQQTQQQAVALELALDKLKRTQAQLIQAEKMSSLGQMVAGIAHEINNPVSFIYGNLTPARHYCQDLLSLVELYQQTYPHPTLEIQQFVEEIDLDFLVEDWPKLMDSMQVGAERIREIVRSLRNFSRLDEKELKPVDIHEGIDNTLLILQHRLRAEGEHPEIQVIKDYGQLPIVTCYASQLNQVFMNLLSNAIDALENQPSPRVITIRTSAGTGDWQLGTGKKNPNHQSPIINPQFFVIRIADNGSGMNEDVLQKIFDPFFTTKPVGSGTGLGYPLVTRLWWKNTRVKSIVFLHQGKEQN